MASADYMIIPKTYAKTAATTATALYSAALFVPAFIVAANGANSARVYLGDSGVAAGEGVALNARESASFDPFKMDREQSSYYDLSKFYVRATAASQIVTIMILNKASDNA